MKDNKRLKRKVRNSYIISTVSISLVLFLLGSVGYLLSAAVGMAGALQQHVSVSVELSERAGPEQRESIRRQLEAQQVCAEVSFLSKEEKAADESFRSLFANDFEQVLGENPLLDSYEVRLNAQAADSELLDAFFERVQQMKGVEHVAYPLGLAQEVNATLRRILLVLFAFGGALLFISLVLLNNTLRVSIFSKRYLINTMKLVGATKWFIIKPFLASSIVQGVWAGAIASLLFGAVVAGIDRTLPELVSLAHTGRIGTVVGAMVAGGVVISLLFTTFAVNKFVNMTSNKIHLY